MNNSFHNRFSRLHSIRTIYHYVNFMKFDSLNTNSYSSLPPTKMPCSFPVSCFYAYLSKAQPVITGINHQTLSWTLLSSSLGLQRAWQVASQDTSHDTTRSLPSSSAPYQPRPFGPTPNTILQLLPSPG